MAFRWLVLKFGKANGPNNFTSKVAEDLAHLRIEWLVGSYKQARSMLYLDMDQLSI